MTSWNEIFPLELVQLIAKVEEKITSARTRVQEVALENQAKVLRAFRENQLSESHFLSSTGYGYNDVGRETLEKIYAQTFGAESALVRPHLVSGTHAIATALFGLLRPGEELLYITGEPYDTLLEVVGVAGNGIGSLKEYGIGYDFVPLNANGSVEFEKVRAKITEKTKVIAIQRSRGYAGRASFSVAEIEKMCRFIKEIREDLVIFADNCYGEFAEEREPTEVGVDILAGSLIKNPGGGLVRTGGYIAGKAELVEKCAARLTTSGVGAEGGAMLGVVREALQGFFFAPHVVSQAIQGAIFTAALLEEMHVDVQPKWNDPRTDLIQTLELKEKEAMISFCQVIQKFSPVDSHVLPIPEPMPGYTDEVIMAAGTFVQGASIELSADGPIRAPYRLYLQGGLTYEHVKLAMSHAVCEVYFNEQL